MDADDGDTLAAWLVVAPVLVWLALVVLT